MAETKVTVTLTPAQARAVNHALAFTTAGDADDGGWEDFREMQTALRARSRVMEAMQSAGVSP